jgi:hypothetical protein
MPRWFNTAGPCNPADHYPASLAFIGLRDVRDDKAASGDHDSLGTHQPLQLA